MKPDLGSVRRTQVITTYGPGALIAVGNESFMVAGLDRWGEPEMEDRVPEQRLEQAMQVRGLYGPPAADQTDGPYTNRSVGLPVVRFPHTHSCPSCNRLAPHWELTDGDRIECARCEEQLVPSRFVAACPDGHIEDFPYNRWVHRGRAPEGRHALTLKASGTSAALRDIVVSCSCGVERSLDGAFDRNELGNVARCQGKRPWLDAAEPCGAQLRALQRGASNIWFPSVRSALSIPPWSDGALRTVERHWPVLRSVSDPQTLRLILTGLKNQTGGQDIDVDEQVRAVQQRQGIETTGEPLGGGQLREQEYQALLTGRRDQGTGQEFVADRSETDGPIAKYFDSATAVTRLREVRALIGFSRLQSVSDADDAGVTTGLAPLASNDPDWYPAVEVRGEGVFLRFDLERLEAWERRPSVLARISLLEERRQDRDDQRAPGGKARPDARPVTARLVLAHTFAHALIEQLSLDAGYPASALRERLYVSDEMRGVLIYTASSDSAGSLGGLVAQASPDRIGALIRDAVLRASWCSSDPVCIESTVSGTDGLNLAACHACTLLPETSCEEMNVLLDRALLVGGPDGDLAYFDLSEV